MQIDAHGLYIVWLLSFHFFSVLLLDPIRKMWYICWYFQNLLCIGKSMYSIFSTSSNVSSIIKPLCDIFRIWCYKFQQVSVWYFQDLVLCFSKSLYDIFRIWSYVSASPCMIFSGFGPMFQQVPVWYFQDLVLCFSKSLYTIFRIWLYSMYYSQDLVLMFLYVLFSGFGPMFQQVPV